MPTTKKVASSTKRKSSSTADGKTALAGLRKVSKAAKKSVPARTAISKKRNVLTPGEPLKKNGGEVGSKISTINKSLKSKLPSLQLALLSPYRFPISAERFAISTARFGGVFFVAVGAFFTLFFASGSFGGGSELAQLSSATAITGQTGNITVAIDCADPLHYLSTSCAGTVDKTPDVEFQIDDDVSVMGISRVRVIVAHADKVHLNAYFKTQSRELQIASMQKISDDTWEFYWDTTAFDDGEYKLKALIENGYGTYEMANAKYITIENRPISIDTAKTATTTVTNSVSSSADPASQIDQTLQTSSNSGAILTVQQNVPQNEFSFDISSESADKVKIFAYHVLSAKNTLLGYAVKDTATTWEYVWRASSVEDGEYRITAQVIADSIEQTSNTVILYLKKQSATDLTASSTNTNVSLDEQVLKPKVSIQVQASSPIAKAVGIKIDVDHALKVELYVQERNGLVKKYLGTATNSDTDTWVYGLDTTRIPDGEYTVIASVKNQYGIYESESAFVKIQNASAVSYTLKQDEQIKVLSAIDAEIKEKTEDDKTVETGNEELNVILADLSSLLEGELQRFASALRMNNEKAISSTRSQLEKRTQEIIRSKLGDEFTQDSIEQINSRLGIVISRTEENVKATEKIIVERMQKEASQDSDLDGIADYDEVALYKTDPFAADSDNDGFTDGAEILNGYDPTDPSAETFVVFESPKESGIVREDILEVNSVITAVENEDNTHTAPEAIISGKALPNSFVTLYIFSTPTIVTIKTDADGSWNYRFDKELEDGEHQVYVGVTDNAGKIVAKSTPFTFIKTAEAFGPANTSEKTVTPVIVQKESFLSVYMVYLVLSISVVAIGLVLILLGLHLDARQRKIGIVTEATPAVL